MRNLTIVMRPICHHNVRDLHISLTVTESRTIPNNFIQFLKLNKSIWRMVIILKQWYQVRDEYVSLTIGQQFQEFGWNRRKMFRNSAIISFSYQQTWKFLKVPSWRTEKNGDVKTIFKISEGSIPRDNLGRYFSGLIPLWHDKNVISIDHRRPFPSVLPRSLSRS